MKGSSTSPITVAVIVSAYLGGIVTVAVLSCDDWRSIADVINTTSFASSSDGGGEQSSDLSVLAFVFEEETEEVVGVTASVHEGSAEVILNGVKLYRTDETTLVVEVETEIYRNIRPHFYFLNREGEVVQEYRASAYVDQYLITFDEQSFGEMENGLDHDQPDEIDAEVGDCIQIPLENKRRMWVNGKFHTLWRVVNLPSDSYVASPSNLVNSDQPSIVGIADGASGEIITLEVLSK